MNYSWSKTVFPIAALFSFRMLGLFLLIPVLTLYANQFSGATPALVGIALGSYGLSQGLLQIPFGFLSDRLGRKRIITLGLILFAIGSLIGALTHSIYGIILARTIQGTGAIGSVLIALLADLTPEQDRTKAMAVIGMTIGISFSLAMVISPVLSHRFGLSGIFYLTTLLAGFGLVLLHGIIPTPQNEVVHQDSDARLSRFKLVLTNPELLRLNWGIFCQHFILTSTFFALPLILKEQIHAGHLTQTWIFYLSIVGCAFITMIPFILLGERKGLMKQLFVGCVLTASLVQGVLSSSYHQWPVLCLLLFLYFVAFNLLEALLPAQISKKAPPHCKGTAMGIYSTSQFLGLFAGGTAAGFLYQWNQNRAIFITNMGIGLSWFLCSVFMEFKKKEAHDTKKGLLDRK